jgi:hypothetical protein
MNILLSFLQDQTTLPHSIPAYRFWSYYIKNGIEQAGMKWLEVPGVDWAAGLVPYEGDPVLETWKTNTWEKTVSYVEVNRANIDVFLCYLYPKQIDKEAIKRIRALGVPCINFYCDNIRSFKRIPPSFKVFDLMWVPEFEALDMYKNAGVKYINLPMPMWVAPQYRVLPLREDQQVSFIGSKDRLRAQLLADVIKKDLKVNIRGNGWLEKDDDTIAKLPVSLNTIFKNQLSLIKRDGINAFLAHHFKRYSNDAEIIIPQENILPQPNFEEYIDITRESCITIGINRVPLNNLQGGLTTYSRLRDLEAPMLGACYLTEYTDGLAMLYDTKTEITTYTNADELLAKSNVLLKSQTKRTELRVNGQARALNDHAIPTSLAKIKAALFK